MHTILIGDSSKINGYRLTAFLVLNATFVWLISYWPAPLGDTDATSNPGATLETLTMQAWDDSWRPMAEALSHLRSGDLSPIYTEFLINRGIKFQYPLTSLIPFSWLETFAEATGIDFLRFMAIVGLIWLAGIIMCCSALTFKSISASPLAAICLSAFATLTYYPITRGYTLGQIQIWINALFAGAVLSWLASKKQFAGLLIGLCASLKPQFAAFLLWGSVRREWGFVAACAMTGATGLLASVAIFGIAHNLDYLDALSLLSVRGEGFFANHSVNGILNRFIGIAEPDLINNLKWSNGFPPYRPLVYFGTMLTSFVLIIAALARRSSDEIFDFCAFALAVTMASPIAWEHHYGILLPIYIVAVARFGKNPAALAILATSYIMTANFWPVADYLAATHWNFVQAYVFWGALLLYGLMLYRPVKLRTGRACKIQ